jgi:hypothetical protein
LLEALTCFEQVRRQLGPADVDAQSLDQARALDDRAARLPERASLARTRFCGFVGGESERAVLWRDLVHDKSVASQVRWDIRVTH